MRSAVLDALLAPWPCHADDALDVLDLEVAAILLEIGRNRFLEQQVMHLLFGDERGASPPIASPSIMGKAAQIARALQDNVFIARDVLAVRFPKTALRKLRMLHPKLVDPVPAGPAFVLL